MFGEHFVLNEENMHIIEEIGRHMPGGFFIYKSEAPEELLYANHAVIDMFGCDDLEDFKRHTGYTFKGMLYPEDYEKVSSSIVDQIKVNDDNMDYVEYRIVRKDGRICWVDDYGHFTDTDEYGGIYYVFISDITERKEKAEQDRQKLIEQIESAASLANLMGSVTSLLTNMPAMSFSKDAETGRYLACNQPFAEYAHRKSPDEVVGLTDHDIFDKETADHFVEDDRKTIEMDEPYIFFEDVPDAKGVVRNLQTTKMKFTDANGKLCTLGMCVDVTEMTQIKQAETEARIKQQELEERVELQSQLLEQSQMITAMASDYRCVYYVTLDTDEGICYRTDHPYENSLDVGDHFSFQKVFGEYAARFVTDEYRDGFLDFISIDKIRLRLAKERIITYRYLIERDGRESYEMLRMAGVRHPEDRDDHKVHAVGVGFTDIDLEMRDNLARNQALSDALTAAEEANKAKTVFLSNMSHEIRTPMNAIIGLNNIALNDPDISGKTKNYLEKIGASAHHLMNIINDILDMSRIESGRMTINNVEFSFSKALDAVNTIISGQCRDKGINYECHIKGKIDDYYYGDDMKIRQVLINILGNAVKFTPEGGRVALVVEELTRFDRKATIRFVISDTGIGMSPEFLPKIFETFSQEDSSATNKYGSTGLGMPITKNIVELMNGNIDVESEKGIGTTFTVTITLGESERVTEKTGADEIQPDDMSVLVIDDNPTDCEYAKFILGQVGIKCDLAPSGPEGIDMIKESMKREEPYNLILVDWKMPGMDGVETTRNIRQSFGDDAAIIILTSYSWDDIIDEAKAAGVDSFVSKPLFAGTVMDVFREAFKKKNEQLLSGSDVDLKGCRILLAEDMSVNAEIMMMILGMREIEADHAENGRIAVEMYKDKPEGYYDAILMDMRMPEMNGLEASKLIRSSGRSDAATIPIIALTANAFDEDVQRSLQAGLNAHLSKPVEAESLYETLERLIGTKTERQTSDEDQ